MSEPNIQRILDNAATKYGSIPVSIAVELYGEAVIFDCNNQVPVWAEMDKINQIESQVNTFLNKTEISNAEKPLSIATEADEAKQENAEKVEETEAEEKEFKEQTQFSDAELFEIVLNANKQNATIGVAIVQKLYGEKGFDVDGSFSGLVNVHKVAFVKGLITQLLNAKTAEKVEEVQPKEETPAEAPQSENTGELKADSEVKSESENAEVKPS